MKKPLYLGMSIIDMSKTLMCEFWYDYFKHKAWGQSETMLYGY